MVREKDNEKALELRRIKIGLTNGKMVEVLKGLATGDRPVTKGSLFIDRANIRVAGSIAPLEFGGLLISVCLAKNAEPIARRLPHDLGGAHVLHHFGGFDREQRLPDRYAIAGFESSLVTLSA